MSLTTGEAVAGEAVSLTCFKKSKPDAGRLAARLAAALKRLDSQPGWKAMGGQVARSSTGGSRPVAVEVHGLGNRTDFNSRQLTKWLEKTVSTARREGRREITIILPDHAAARGRQAMRILVQLLGSGYRFDRFRARDPHPQLRKIHLLPPAGENEVYAQALRTARPVARGIRFCKDLGNTPPNEATPEWMAQQAADMAAKRDIDCQILLPPQLEELGMGGILAVGAGSVHAPRLVRLEWGEGDELISFVGKGVTFDTGGISIKPGAAMEEMKYDKCGACTVLGIAQALSELRVPGRYQAYLPFVENMPDGRSYRPSDIVRCYNGKTVEILNTDAEGRMILADAMSWAAEGKPDTMVEMSTLTGATVVALGYAGAALYSPADSLVDELLEAAAESGDRLWRMPLWPDFAEDMKGVHADLRNLGSRWGGANNAAAFLSSFVGQTKRWAHLDIAGTAYVAPRKDVVSGATGFGVALVAEWLLARTGSF